MRRSRSLETTDHCLLRSSALATTALLVVALGAAGSCSSDGATGVDDTGRIDDASDSGVDETEPDTGPGVDVQPPVLAPCPTGWREVAGVGENDVITCDPWPAEGPQSCSGAEAQFPGEPSCAPIGPSCPTGAWPEGLPTDRPVLYVDPTAAEGGTGALESPFQQIGDAITEAESGTIVALAKGTFDETVTPTEGITLWGACAAETILAPTSPWVPDEENLTGVVTVATSDVTVRNLTVTGQMPGIVATEDGSVTVENAFLFQTVLSGLLVAGGELTGDTLIVRDTQPMEGSEALNALGLFAVFGGAADLNRVAFEQSAVLIGNESHLSLDNAFIRAAQASDDAGTDPLVNFFGETCDGVGLAVDTGATVEISRSIIEQNQGGGILVSRFDGPWETDSVTLTCSDVVVRGPDGLHPTLTGSYGLEVKHTDVVIERTVVERSRGNGIVVTEGAHLRLANTIVRDTVSYGTEREQDVFELGYGIGLVAGLQSSVDAENVLFLRNRLFSVWVLGGDLSLPASSFTGTDVVIAETLETECLLGTCGDRTYGTGVVSYSGGAELELANFRVTGSALAGLQLYGGVADLHDGEISSNLIGVNIQTDDFDISRLQDGVLYFDNGRNLDSQQLPVPSPGEIPF